MDLRALVNSRHLVREKSDYYLLPVQELSRSGEPKWWNEKPVSVQIFLNIPAKPF